jgi:hypothetical protein
MSDTKQLNQLHQRVTELEQQNAQLRGQLPASDTATGFNWRRFVYWVLLVSLLLSLTLGALLVWLNRTILDPQRYIDTVGPVIQEPAVQKAITAHAADSLYSQVSVEQTIADTLPPQATFLAPSIASQVKSQITNQIGQIVASDRFHTAWVNTNERAHQRFVQIAENGRESPVITVNDLYQTISTELAGTRLEPLLNKSLPARLGEVQVANVPALTQIPHYVTTLQTWRWVLLLLSLALAGLAVWAARIKRRALGHIGAITIISALLIVVAMRVTRALMLGNIGDPVDRDAASAIWGVITQYLYVQLGVMLALGIILVAISWALGESRSAQALRARASRLFTDTRTRWLPNYRSMPVFGFVQKRRRLFEWGLIGASILVTLALMPLTAWTLIIIVGVALLLLMVIEFIGLPDRATVTIAAPHKHKVS